jgi:hypothetical protein
MAYADEYDIPDVSGFDANFRKNGFRLPGGEEVNGHHVV